MDAGVIWDAGKEQTGNERWEPQELDKYRADRAPAVIWRARRGGVFGIWNINRRPTAAFEGSGAADGCWPLRREDAAAWQFHAGGRDRSIA